MVAELQALILISQILAMLRQSRKELFIQLFYQLALQSNYFDKGLIKKKGNTFTVFTHPQSNPNADTVNNFVIKGNVYYMATQSGIHICYNTAFGNIWTKYDTTNTSLPTNSINALDIDSKGIFWLATNIGVIRFDPIKNETKIYSKKESEFWTDNILSIKVLPNDEVWAGSENRNVFKVGLFLNEYNTPGLFHFNQNKFINYLSEIGLCDLKIIPSSTFRQILNEGNNIWFSAYINNSHGIFMTDGSNVLIKKLTTVASSNGNFIATKKGNSLLISGYFQGYDRIKIDLNDTKLDSNYIAFSIRKDTSTSPYGDIPANLEINNLNVPLLIDGDLFWNFDNSTLKVKSSKCNSIALAGGIWMGGISDGNLHLATALYRKGGRDYGKGPLKIGNFTTNNESQLKFQSTWKVEEKTIDEFKLNFNKPGYLIPKVILNWPAHGDTLNGYANKLAPFIDLNKNGLYEPFLGDYPDIKGQQNHFWIFNDNTYIHHSESDGHPIGVEVHANAYGYVCNQINDQNVNKAINNTIFLKYKIINRSNRTYTDFSLGFWMDPDIGNRSDDKVGSNPKEGYAYWYNSDTLDEGFGGFGSKLPACALIMLPNNNDSIHRKLDLARFVTYKNDFSVIGIPARAEHYYNYLQGKWKSSQKITYGGDGTTGNDSQNIYMFPGKNDLSNRPEWTDDSSSSNNGFRNIILSSKNITFKPGDEREVTFALVYTPTNFNQKDLILEELNKDVIKVKNWYANQSFPSCSTFPLKINEQTNVGSAAEIKLYPNPSSSNIYFEHNLGSKITAISLYNLNGKLIYKEMGSNLKSLNLESYLEGIYFLQLETKEGNTWKKVIKN